ncbi:hypothetical protein CBR_g8296 [Chara braunii]|uniref:Retrotransposon gag domain-containing protein n=1 Tax=Chara braunii TaxID=69332 RepID=A0A388KLT1_CHABU|nr:hypothetical protein CBR_g8296 [Chara braunii]|eukprot:GBG70997.1 hypothetical protein CBR_g8296 [Chara braunii]
MAGLAQAGEATMPESASKLLGVALPSWGLPAAAPTKVMKMAATIARYHMRSTIAITSLLPPFSKAEAMEDYQGIALLCKGQHKAAMAALVQAVMPDSVSKLLGAAVPQRGLSDAASTKVMQMASTIASSASQHRGRPSTPALRYQEAAFSGILEEQHFGGALRYFCSERSATAAARDTAKQLGERIDHVVNLIGELGDFTSPATISSTVAAIKTDITKLQSRPDAGTKAYKMPRFNIGKFDDYNRTDALTWWQGFLTEASCHTVPAEDMMKALYLQLIGGAQAWMNHTAANLKCTIAQLHTHIPWKQFKKMWFTRFMVRNVVKAAMNDVYSSSQGNMPTRDWTIKWQKIVTTPGFDLSFLNQRSEFFSRLCTELRPALDNEYNYASFQAILDRANLVIQTDDKAANE